VLYVARTCTEPRTLILDDFRSSDPAMQKCLDLARLAARTDLPILIVGESGTGKSLLARAIHDSSKRRPQSKVLGAGRLYRVTSRSSSSMLSATMPTS
jgi:transcriptional regulator with PAS, ATPase and Fis domain